MDPPRAQRERLAEDKRQCPPGAPQSRRADGTNPEVPDAGSTAALAPDGPINYAGGFVTRAPKARNGNSTRA